MKGRGSGPIEEGKNHPENFMRRCLIPGGTEASWEEFKVKKRNTITMIQEEKRTVLKV